MNGLFTVKRVKQSDRIYLENSQGTIIAAECRNCSTIKAASDFHSHRGKATRLQTYCRPCDHAIRKKNYKRKGDAN